MTPIDLRPTDRTVKVLGIIWTVMATIFGATWALYARDFTMIAGDIREMKSEQAKIRQETVDQVVMLRQEAMAQSQRTDDRILRLYEVIAERLAASKKE